MAMTKAEKRELARCVKWIAELGYSKTEAINKIKYALPNMKRRTIEVYWKIFNEMKEQKP